MLTEKIFKGHYVVISKEGVIMEYTWKPRRKESVEAFIEFTNYSWGECLAFGWKCIKVDVTFSPYKN